VLKEVITTIANPKFSYASTVSEFTAFAGRIHDLLDRQAELLPNRFVYGFPHQQTNLTFGELHRRVKTMTTSLHELGLRKGDRIAIALPNTHELLVIYMAACKLGLITVIMNPAYQVVEFEFMLKKTNAKAMFVYDTFKILNHIGLLQKLCPELETSLPGELNSKNLPDLKHVVVLNSPLSPEKKTYPGTWQYSQLSEPKSQNSNLEFPYVDIEDPCTILFTSGTTGMQFI
jgi:fatty-acyl-CoA synthase